MDQTIIYDDQKKAEAFNDFFIGHSSLDTSNANLPPDTIAHNNTLNHIEVTSQDVLDILLNLNAKKASGPDGISPRVLKEAGNAIAPSLATLLNLSLLTKKL